MPNLRYCLRFIFPVCLLLNNQSVHAEEDYWTCTAHDRVNKEWLIQDMYSIAANHKALAACKKESAYPESCDVNPDQDCEGFYNGRSTRPSWQCSAIDQNGKAWNNPANRDQDKAAMLALSLCQQNSSVAESCYMNALSCINLNQ